MDKWLYIGLLAVGFASGWFVRGTIAERDMAEYQKAQAKVVQEAQENHARSLAKATDTILTAQEEYDSVRRERDAALERLRNNASGGDKGSSEATLRARIASCERMVKELAEAGSRCGDGWQRCAQKHDALAQAVKP